MDTSFESKFLEELKTHITPLDFSLDTELSVYKNNLIDSIEIKFSQSDNSYIVIVFKFQNKHMDMNVGDMNGGDVNMLDFKNFFDGIFNILAKSYMNLFILYRTSYHYK